MTRKGRVTTTLRRIARGVRHFEPLMDFVAELRVVTRPIWSSRDHISRGDSEDAATALELERFLEKIWRAECPVEFDGIGHVRNRGQ